MCDSMVAAASAYAASRALSGCRGFAGGARSKVAGQAKAAGNVVVLLSTQLLAR